ncbi:type II toxin-antitoxin system RelE/ParE family toxin [Pedobacter glucosidilyticus]|uniref:type II toxin-antitoxin system RelE/ParE family toxin n=1 Tax=Pedobacter glucosidilyticus TaxID=1122941 RepID=UPI0026EFB4A0|nr:type II toxin-antitoxin system RelE/ParE family toxin [Pedobacter glucosidilyticus]
MINEIVWSPESENDLSIILEYLISKWNIKVATHFLNEIEHQIKLIDNNPKLYPIIHEEQQFRQCVIIKHNSLIYYHENKQIIILRIFDTRQHPKKLKFQ